VIGREPRVGQSCHPRPRGERRGAARSAAGGQLGLEGPLGGGPGHAGLGHQPDPAVVVAELDPDLDPPARQGEAEHLAVGAQRQRRTSHVAPPASPVKSA
jgi:hypothetical protein